MSRISSKRNYVPSWIRAAREMSAKTGDVDLSSNYISDISLFPVLKTMKSLCLNFTTLSSLVGIREQPNLRNLSANDSQLEDLGGFLSFPNLTNLTLENTILESQPHLLVALACVCPKLTTFNHKVIPEKYRIQAMSLPEGTADMINAGWTLHLPVTEEEIRHLLKETYGEEHPYADADDDNESGQLSFVEIVDRIQKQHDDMVNQFAALCGINRGDKNNYSSEIQLSDFNQESESESTE